MKEEVAEFVQLSIFCNQISFRSIADYRRQILKTTLLFGSAMLGAGSVEKLSAAATTQSRFKGGVHLLAVGDFGSNNDKQTAVARQMNAFAGTLGAPFGGVLALGANFEPNDFA